MRNTQKLSDPAKVQRRNVRWRNRRRYYGYTALCRFYMTLVMGALSAIGAVNWSVVGGLVISGLLMDFVRNRISLDLVLGPDVIAAEYGSAIKPGVEMKERWLSRSWLLLYAGLSGYMAVLIGADLVLGTAQVATYLKVFSPLHDVASTFVSMIRRHASQLRDQGHADRALLATHVYTVAVYYFIGGTFVFSTFVYKASVCRARALANKSGRAGERYPVRTWHLTILSLLPLFLYWLQSNVVSVSDVGRYQWNIGVSDSPYIFITMWSLAISSLLIALYGALFRRRAVLSAALANPDRG